MALVLLLAGCGTKTTNAPPQLPKLVSFTNRPPWMPLPTNLVLRPPWSNMVVGAQWPALTDFTGGYTPTVALFQTSTDLQTWSEVTNVPYPNSGGWLYCTNTRAQWMFFRAGYR